MTDTNNALGPTELDVLRCVGDNHPISVADVVEIMSRSSGQARTTILTTMERLREKGYLTRKKLRNVYHYSPRLSTNELLSGLVKKFVNTTLGGSVSPFVAYLSENGSVSDEELNQLKQLVRQLDEQGKGSQK